VDVFVDGASEIGDIDVDFGVGWEDLLSEGEFDVPAFAVASLDDLAQLLVERRVDFVLL